MEQVVQCLSSFIGCLGFSFIFRIHKNFKFSVIGSVIGTIGWIIYLFTYFLDNIFIQSFLAMLCVAIMAETMARVYKAPATIFIIIGCFPLVPGSGIYYTMLYAVQGHNQLFMESFLSTMSIGISLALAILISTTIFQVYRRIKTKDFIHVE